MSASVSFASIGAPKRVTAWLLIGLAAMALGSAAHAQESAETEAQALFRRGVEAFRAEDFPSAASAFESSFALDPKPAALCNMALVYDRWEGHALDAVKAYQRCARVDDTGRFREYALTRAEAILATLSGAERASVERSRSAESGVSTGSEDAALSGEANERETDEPIDGRREESQSLVGESAASPERRMPVEDGAHPLLYLGIGAAVLAAGALVTGIVLITSANSDLEALDREYGVGGQVVIPAGTPDAERYMDAENATDLGVIMYVAAGVLAAVGGTLIAVDLALPDVTVAASDDRVMALVRWRTPAL